MKGLKKAVAFGLTVAMLLPNCLTVEAANNSQRNLYSQVFDAQYYASAYPDVVQVYGTDPSALLNHYIDHGVKEGRYASASFNATAYLNNYSDLKSNFGTNYEKAVTHYVQYGVSEGRSAVSATGGLFVADSGAVSTTGAVAQAQVPTTGIASCTTYYDATIPRATNVQLAASKINGYVLAPGQEFSYNAVVGQRTTAAGFVSAPIFVGGKHGYGIGGGICQVSSTLYSACLDAGLQITERSAHSLRVSYLPAGRDATVSWGTKDYKFVNNTGRTITILASAVNGALTVTIQ